jgi:carbon-monoxide dehydrogenase large subunit
VLAVITAETLKTVNLAWMPTLAGDVQMVLADGKVLFQNQEVAFVVATDRYAPMTASTRSWSNTSRCRSVIDPSRRWTRRACAARGSRRQDFGRARAAQASQPHLRVDVGDKD